MDNEFKFNIPRDLQKYLNSLPTTNFNGRRILNVNLIWKLDWNILKKSSIDLYVFYALISKQLFL